MKIPLFRSVLTCLTAGLLAATAHAQHGPGPEMKPLPVAEKAARVSFAESVKADPALAAFFGDFAEALRTHDGKPFLPRLADTFTIEGFPGADMKAAFVKAMTMIASPDELVLTAIEPRPDGTQLIKTDFKFPKRTAKREFVLTADHRLVSTTLMVMRRAPAGETPRGH
jgi:hypothetical protein